MTLTVNGEPTEATTERFGDLVGGMPSMPPLVFFFSCQQKSIKEHRVMELKAGTNRLTFDDDF